MPVRMKGVSLTHHLVLWFIVVALLPLLLFGYLTLRQNEAALRTETQARMSLLADKKAIEIKVYLAERAQDAKMLARGVLVEQAMSGLSRAYLQYRPGSDGYRREDKQFRSRFSVYIDESTLFYDVFLITPQGEIIYTDKHEADFATNLLNGPYRDSQLAKAFRESSMTFESNFSGFEIYAPSGGAPAAFIAAPIIRNGALRGVVAFQLSAENIYRVAMDNIGLGVTGETPLAKLTGTGEAMFVAPLRRDPQAAMQRKLDLKTTVVPMRYALAGERGSGVEIDYAGKQVVAAWRYLPALRWGMVVKMDTDEVFAPLYKQQQILLEILLALILLAGVVAFYFGRRLVVPLKDFAQTAAAVAQGDLGKRVAESGSGEIGALGRAFNRMAENLQSLYRTLENRVEERTRELNVSNELLQHELYEHKLAEQALIRSETKFHTLYDSTSDAVMLLDENGFFDCNKAALAIFGCATREEFCSKHPADLSPPKQPCGTDSMLLARRQIATAIKQGSNYFEWVHQRVDTGKAFHADVLLSSMELDGRTVLQATVRDISERKRAEAAVLQLNEDLEIKVAARTAALEQAMLEVKQASRSKDEFLAAISHELKTPLNHILGFADLLKEGLAGELNAEQKGMAQDIFDAGSKQLALIKSLIELARLQAGKVKLQAELENPARMLGEIATQHVAKAKTSSLTFAVEVTEGLGEMPLDREVVTHLLDQLLANAFKFTPSGGKVSLVARRVPRTEVAAPVRIETDEYLELAVVDNGPGIAPEILPRLFQPFVQGDGRLSRSHQGNGVGLVLVRLLAELHGGSSAVQSKPGIGTKFLVWLPIGKQQQ